jgi:tRNA dimethylallyltransferase
LVVYVVEASPNDIDYALQPQIHEMHQKKEIPIVVGGTSYWIQHLVFPNRLSKPSEATATLDAPWDPELQKALDALPQDMRSLFEGLPEEPPIAKTDPDAAFQLHALLLLLDPPVGQRWHWKDTRKVLHSLSIIRSARRRASDIIAQQAADTSSDSRPRFAALSRQGDV